MITILHRGGSFQFITRLHGGGGGGSAQFITILHGRRVSGDLQIALRNIWRAPYLNLEIVNMSTKQRLNGLFDTAIKTA